MVVNCKGTSRLFQGNLGEGEILFHLARSMYFDLIRSIELVACLETGEDCQWRIKMPGHEWAPGIEACAGVPDVTQDNIKSHECGNTEALRCPFFV